MNGDAAAGGCAEPKAGAGVGVAGGWLCAKGFNEAPNFGANSEELAGACADGCGSGAAGVAKAARGFEAGGCGAAGIAGMEKEAGGDVSTRLTWPWGVPG